ncbi:MAG: Hsp20 family protein [Bacteroidia bacterium]|nr:Hsp20 family protein [Bacteroidia bacterium]
MFKDFFEESRLSQSVNFIPQSDIVEKEDHFEIQMSLPGIKKEDVKISLEGDLLSIEGERKMELKEEKEKFVRRELSYGKFSRSFNVSKLDTANIEAKFEHGLLNISIPKSKIEKSSQIEIK